MNPTYYDFAKCHRCGFANQIRPTTLPAGEIHQASKEADSEPLFVACAECRRVYRYDSTQLLSRPESIGVKPYDPDAPIRVFQIPLECDEPNCEVPLEVLAVRSGDIFHEDVEKESHLWRGDGLKCPMGHEISLPGWR